MKCERGADAADVGRWESDEAAGQAFQEFHSVRGQSGAAGLREQIGGAEAQDVHDARGRSVARLRRDRRKRLTHLVPRGSGRAAEVDPRLAREVLRLQFASEQPMIVPGNDDGGHVGEALAAHERRQGFVADDDATMLRAT